MKNPISLFLCILFLLVGSGIAYAQTGPDDAGGLFNAIYDAIKGGDYAIAITAGVVLLVALVRRYLGSRISFLSHRLIAPLLVLLSTASFSLLSALQAGQPFDMPLLWATIKTAVIAAGGYSLLKPYIEAAAAHAPPWARWFFDLLGLVFNARSQARLAAAKAAGEAAVLNQQPEGLGVDPKQIK